RHHPRGVLLPGNGRLGRPPASTRMRATLAPQAESEAARRPAHAARRQLRARLLPRDAKEEDARRDGARSRRVPSRVLPPAPPQPAQPAVAEEPSLVRPRRGAAAEKARQGLPGLARSAERVKFAA